MVGLRLAELLRERGETVDLYEHRPAIGGMADAWQLGDITWDRHYHVILEQDTQTLALLERLKLRDQLVFHTTRTGFFTDGRLHSLSSSLDFLRFSPLSLWQKFRLGLTILHCSRIKDPEPLAQISVESFLRRLSGNAVFDKIWQPLLQAKLGEAWRDVSAGFIWAIIDRMYRARRSGNKTERFGYVRGGYNQILAKYQKSLERSGVRLLTGHRVLSVKPGFVVTHQATREGQTPRQSRYRGVISTLAAPLSAKLFAEEPDGVLEALRSVPYQGVVCLSLLSTSPLAGYYVTNITERSVPFTGVIEMTSLVNRDEVGGHNLIYIPHYAAPDDPLFEEDDASIYKRAVTHLASMFPSFEPEHVQAYRISRVRNVVPITRVGTTQPPPVALSQPGLYALGSAQIQNATLNVAESLHLAERSLAQLQLPALISAQEANTRVKAS